MLSLKHTLRGLAALALVGVLAGAGPEPFHVTGQVVDATSGQPLEGVQVFVPNTTYGVLTDTEGRYVITIPDKSTLPEQLRVEAVLLGYGKGSAMVRAAEHRVHGSVTVNFQLTAVPLSLDELAVTGNASEAEARSRLNRPEEVASRGDVSVGPAKVVMPATSGRRLAERQAPGFHIRCRHIRNRVRRISPGICPGSPQWS